MGRQEGHSEEHRGGNEPCAHEVGARAFPGLGPISRRDFLKIAGATGAAIGLSGGIGGLAAACEQAAKTGETRAGTDATSPTPAAPLKNQPDAWVPTGGPAGGVLNVVDLHPDDPDVVFAGGAGGVYQSTSRGDSWSQLPLQIAMNRAVTHFFINPADPLIMYALAGWLHMTTDGGRTWTQLLGQEEFACMAMDPADPRRLAVGRGDGLVKRSTDGGSRWQDITAGLPGTGNLGGPGIGPGYSIKCLTFGRDRELWAGTGVGERAGDGRLYRRSDGGRSWVAVEIPGQGPAMEIHSLHIDPEDSALMYVGLRNIHNEMFDKAGDLYLAKSTDGGGSWSRLTLPSADAMINVMGRASYDSALYVGDGGYLYRSDDGGSSWTTVTPRPGQNGDVYDIAIDPRDTKVLYVPRRARGIVKSTDRGKSWTPINQGILNTVVPLLALGDAAGSIIHAATMSGEGTFRSTDWGESWENVTDGGISHPWADELVVSPTDPATVWEVADVGQFFVSHDYGSKWKMTVDPRGPGRGFRAGTILAAAAAPSDPQRIYAVKSGFGIFRSTSTGKSWDFLHQSEVDYTYGLAVHPTNPDIVFSGYSPKPFQDWAMVRRSTDGGQSWATVLEVARSTGITSVEIDPQDPSVVYATSTGSSEGGGGQVYRSADGGDTWTPLNPHFTMLTVWGQPQLVGDPRDPETVYAATWLGGTWKTTDAGRTWTLLDQAPRSCTALSLNAQDPQVIYAADRTAPKVWKSRDGGEHWVVTADFSSAKAFLVNRVLVAGEAVYASTFGPGMHDGKLYRSNDGGSKWTDITSGLPRSVLDLAIDQADPRIIYATTHIWGAYKSIDGGKSWAELERFPAIGAYDIEIDPEDSNIVYAAGLGACTVPDWVMPGGHVFADPAGVYKSTDGGATWSNVLVTSNECRAVRLYPGNPSLLFAAALSDGFFLSEDAGGSWTNFPIGLDSLNLTSVWACGDKVYAGTQGFGIYSGDLDPDKGLVGWVPERSNRPVPMVHNLQLRVDPTDSARLYLGSNPGGLFRSDDGGETWYDKNFLTPSVVVDDPRRQGYYTFAINPEEPDEVWVGTWGKGVYKSYDGQDFNIGAHGRDRVMFGKHVNALLFHPELGLVAATEEGIFRTTDGGGTWEEFNGGLGPRQVRTLSLTARGMLICGTAGYEMYAGSSLRWEQLPGFDNFGTFWPIWNDRPLYQYSQLLFHPTDPNIVYFGTFPAGVYKSLDGGETWREYNVGWLNDGVFTLVCVPDDPDVIYAGTYNGVNRSLDAGAHWERWDEGWPGEQWVFSIDFDPADPQVMYACSKNGELEGVGRDGFHGTVMKSTNGGALWMEITDGLDLDQEFYKIIVDRADSKRLYLATQFQGVWTSLDGGGRWEAWNEGLTNLYAATNGNNVTNTMALSADGRMLYFGSSGSGVFRRTIMME